MESSNNYHEFLFFLDTIVEIVAGLPNVTEARSNRYFISPVQLESAGLAMCMKYLLLVPSVTLGKQAAVSTIKSLSTAVT